MHVKHFHLPIVLCVLYFSVHLAQAFKSDDDIQYGLR